MTRTHSTYTGYRGGWGGGGVYEHEATTVNYDDSMIINVGGGDRAGKVFLVSRLPFFFSYINNVRMSLKLSSH